MNSDKYIIAALLALVVFSVTPLHAYLDPGAGSFLLQILLGGLAGLALLLKSYWRKLAALFGGKNHSIEDEDGSEGDSSRS